MWHTHTDTQTHSNRWALTYRVSRRPVCVFTGWHFWICWIGAADNFAHFCDSRVDHYLQNGAHLRLQIWHSGKKKNMSPMSVFHFCDCKMDLTACWCYNIVVMVTKLVPLTTRRPTSSSRFMFFKIKARTTFFFYLWHSDENITPFPHTEYDMWLFQT